MKIGRNDPCPCGSGKKYKKCCIDKGTSIYPQPAMSAAKPDYHPFFSKYNTVAFLQSIAGLSLLPENHGKYVRSEELARTAINKYNNSNEIPNSKVLRDFLDAEYPSHYLEDPPVNLFTSNRDNLLVILVNKINQLKSSYQLKYNINARHLNSIHK